jgi:flagellar hook-associated protein 2
MDSIVKDINNAKLGVTAIYDATADRFFLQTDQTGTANTVTITDNSTLSDGSRFNFITGSNSKLKLNYLDSSGNKQDVLDGTYSGQNAIVDFGAATGIEQGSNQFTLNGISFDLKKTGGPFTVEVKTNVTGIYEKIEKFVNQYNDLIGKLGSKLGEKAYRDYLPLTQEQRESMTEKQIEQWEEKAKSGLLRNDLVLDRLQQSMRSGMYQEVSGVTGIYDQLTQIGIVTEGYSKGSRGGTLSINKTQLTAAIEKDVDSVLELLFKENIKK